MRKGENKILQDFYHSMERHIFAFFFTVESTNEKVSQLIKTLKLVYKQMFHLIHKMYFKHSRHV
jgi:hypothetical protein